MELKRERTFLIGISDPLQGRGLLSCRPVRALDPSELGACQALIRQRVVARWP